MRINFHKTVCFLSVLVISYWSVICDAAPQNKKAEYRRHERFAMRDDNQLQGTVGATLPLLQATNSQKELTSYGLSTPAYEDLESQLQSPQLTSAKMQYQRFQSTP